MCQITINAYKTHFIKGCHYYSQTMPNDILHALQQDVSALLLES